MGHDVHFLERLERLSENTHLDLALALYRDSKLVRYILDRADLPEGAERVALALEDRPGGPHIILARDGGFVTCLGEGMSTGDQPVISHGQVTRLGEQLDGLRTAMGQMDESDEVKRLFRRLATSGSDLSREDFTTLVHLAPLLAYGGVQLAIELAMELKYFERGYRPGRYRRDSARAREELRRYWERIWALGHLIALYGSRGRMLAELVGPAVRDRHDEIVFVLAQAAVRSMFLPTVLRGVWMAAHGGRKRAHLFKQDFQESRCFLGVLMNGLPLMGIGLRHRSMRAEVHKVLGRCLRKLDDPAWSEGETTLARPFLTDSMQLFDAEPAVRARHRMLGAHMVVHAGAPLPDGHPLRFEDMEAVPEELAYALTCNQDAAELFTTPVYQLLLLYTLPWLANASIEDLYMSEAAIEAYGAPWQPAPVRKHLEGHNWYFLRGIPAQAKPKPGRNQPCPCDSGKKYKRCCGAS